MPKYRNTRTDRVVEVPNEAPTRTDRPKRDRQWAIYLAQLDRSDRWERLDATEPEPDGDDDEEEEETSEEPKAAEVRAWAKAEGIDVPARGKLSPEVVEAFKAAHNDGW